MTAETGPPFPFSPCGNGHSPGFILCPSFVTRLWLSLHLERDLSEFAPESGATAYAGPAASPVQTPFCLSRNSSASSRLEYREKGRAFKHSESTLNS